MADHHTRGREGPRLVLGTMAFGAGADEAEAERMVRLCLDGGITAFDTADSYNDGRSEEVLGRVLRRLGDPEVTVTTKVGQAAPGAPAHGRLSAPAVRSAVRASLTRLGREHVDTYLLHTPDRDTPVAETLGALDELVRAGLVGATGQSNHAAWRVVRMHMVCEARGWEPPRTAQVMYNLLARRAEDEYEEAADHLGLVNHAYNPLAGGLLTGAHRYGAPPARGRFGIDAYRRRYWNRRQFAAVTRLDALAAEAGLSLLELSLRWVAHRPLVHGLLLGASDAAQLEQNLRALDGPAPDQDLRALCDGVWDELGGPAPGYHR